MAIDNCSNCPSFCLGNVLPSDCVEYDGASLKSHLESLVITSPTENTPEISSDEVISRSIIRNPAGMCSSSIVERTFNYALSSSKTGSVFGWNYGDIVTALPNGYSASVFRTKVYGATSGGQNIIGDSDKQSSGVNVGTNQYPLTVDLFIRVSSPCGDVDMSASIKVLSPSKVGSFRGSMAVSDLNPETGQVMLTDQLNSLESQLYDFGVRFNNQDDVSTTVSLQQSEISNLSSAISSPGAFEVPYTDGANDLIKELSDIITGLHNKINNLENVVVSQGVEIVSLRAGLDSIK